MNTSAAKVYPSYVYENKMEVSMYDGSSSTTNSFSKKLAVVKPYHCMYSCTMPVPDPGGGGGGGGHACAPPLTKRP